MNVRSLRNKYLNVIEYTQVSESDIVVVTEHWLNKQDEIDQFQLETANLHRIQTHLVSRVQTRGGGALILVNNDTGIKLIKKLDANIKYGVETCSILASKNGVKMIIVAVYCPPESTPRAKCSKVLEDIVLHTRDKYGPVPVMLAGDYNKAKIEIQVKCPYIDQCISLPTRQNVSLDEIYLHKSIQIIHTETRNAIKPDNPNNDTSSDHLVVFAELQISQYQKRPMQPTPKMRITDDNWESIGVELREMSWTSTILGQPNGDAIRLSESLARIIGRNSTPVRIKKKNDKPWYNEVINKLVNIKNKKYAEGGYSKQYKKVKKLLQKEIQKQKRFYYESKVKLLEKSDPAAFYTIVNEISDPDANTEFDPMRATQSETQSEAANKIAKFFANISRGFEDFECQPKQFANGVTRKEVEDAFKAVKIKGNSAIGDINGKMLKKFPNLLLEPIFLHINNCFMMGQWPELYKVETCVSIPKKPNPEKMEEIRLISLTPFISKVMEAIVMKRTETSRLKHMNKAQFGGRRGIGTSHVLADYIQEVISTCQSGGAAVGVFFDFSSAFNTGNRGDMIQGMQKLGVSGQNLQMLGQLLTDRKIVVWVGQTFSTPEGTTGGSAQGTVAGQNFFLSNSSDFDEAFPRSKSDYRGAWAYIDDTQALIELDQKLCVSEDHNGVTGSVFFSNTTNQVIQAMVQFAQRKKFKLNINKTKMLIYGNVPESARVHINDYEIETVSEFKLLGLTLDSKLSMDAHVKTIEKKVGKRIYILRVLKMNGVPKNTLVRLYKSQIRSVIEYCAPVLYSMLKSGQFNRLERLQTICLKTIYGFEFSSNQVRQLASIQTIQDRFSQLTDNFILKEAKNNVMGWFEVRSSIEYIDKLRNPRKFQELNSKSTKMYQGPVAYFIRRLNHLQNLSDSPNFTCGSRIP